MWLASKAGMLRPWTGGQWLTAVTQLYWPVGLFLWVWISFFPYFGKAILQTQKDSFTKQLQKKYNIRKRHSDFHFFHYTFLPYPPRLSSQSFSQSNYWFKPPPTFKFSVNKNLSLMTVLLPPSSFHVLPLPFSLIILSASGCRRPYNHLHFHHILSNSCRECPMTVSYFWMVLGCGNDCRLNSAHHHVCKPHCPKHIRLCLCTYSNLIGPAGGISLCLACWKWVLTDAGCWCQSVEISGRQRGYLLCGGVKNAGCPKTFSS